MGSVSTKDPNMLTRANNLVNLPNDILHNIIDYVRSCYYTRSVSQK